jgi:hypothetical protein
MNDDIENICLAAAGGLLLYVIIQVAFLMLIL